MDDPGGNTSRPQDLVVSINREIPIHKVLGGNENLVDIWTSCHSCCIFTIFTNNFFTFVPDLRLCRKAVQRQ